MFRLYFLSILLLLSGCLLPHHAFDWYEAPPPPDYSKESCWAALPTKKDSADAVPTGAGLSDEQANAVADVFFIHPTTYYSHKSWNASIDNATLNKRTDKTTILNQASVFNGSCKVYAPRYRQATLYTFFDKSDEGKKALDLAYADVKAAFEYYLKNYNHGRPIIIASHSQGTYHAIRLMKDYFEKDSLLRKQLVAAYLIGGPVKKNFLSNIPPCDSASQCGCYVAWNTRKWGAEAFTPGSKKRNAPKAGETLSLECTNPLTWKRDTVYASAYLNEGSIPVRHFRIDKHVGDAKCTPQGTLWVHKPHQSGYPNIFTYHILDYNLFWMNIRSNVKLRVDRYLEHAGNK